MVRCPFRSTGATLLAALSLLAVLVARGGAESREPLEPVPDRLVVLTFDDASRSHLETVAPILERYGFGATFFVSEGFTFRTNQRDYLTWEEIAELHRRGFEIGNHTRDHMAVTPRAVSGLEEQLAAIDARCAEHGIPKPVTFAWPGNALAPGALAVLARHGIRFARRGGAPEHPYDEGKGCAYEPGEDHPLLLPSAADARPDWTLDDFVRGARQAHDGRIAVFQFHGVPDGEHAWVNTPVERFEEYMRWLHEHGYRVVALRDLERWVDPSAAPDHPWNVIGRRCGLVGRVGARELGIAVGSLPPGEWNAITDVPGVRVGHVSIWKGDDVRTGVTAIVPHPRDLFREKVPAAFFRMNGFGKPFGSVQIEELGEIETPILLGPTLSVPRIADAILSWTLARDSTGEVRSINPVVGETNDGWLSDIRARPITEDHVIRAIDGATGGAVPEGSVGAGTGTRCLGFKGGIGTASRVAVVRGERHVVGVLVQSNFGGHLRILGRPVEAAEASSAPGREHGSCAIVVATDAPLGFRALERLARRAFAGMARTGASFSNGSGDYAFAFSTVTDRSRARLPSSSLSPLFTAVADATEEAILDSLLQARSVTGQGGRRSEAIPLDRVRAALREGKREAGRSEARRDAPAAEGTGGRTARELDPGR